MFESSQAHHSEVGRPYLALVSDVISKLTVCRQAVSDIGLSSIVGLVCLM